MVIKVYLSMISCSQEVKKNQQRAVMILESKNIPFITLDITDPGQEDSKDYMNDNARPKGDNKVPMTPQIFNEAEYCGDFDDLDMANETDTLGEFLKLSEEEKKGIKIGITGILPEERARAEKQKKDGLTNGVSAGRETEAPTSGGEQNNTSAKDTPKVIEETIETHDGNVNAEATEQEGGDFFGSVEEAEETPAAVETLAVEETPAAAEEGEPEERLTEGYEVGEEKEKVTEERMEDEAEA